MKFQIYIPYKKGELVWTKTVYLMLLNICFKTTAYWLMTDTRKEKKKILELLLTTT